MTILLCVLVLLISIFLIITYAIFSGQDLTRFDKPVGESFGLDHEPCDEHDLVVASIHANNKAIEGLSPKQRLVVMREYLDSMSDGMSFSSTFIQTSANGIPAQWVVAPGADCNRRLLYIHGGAFTMGSPKGHRNITNNFSKITKAAVLAVDYRLMPEHSRKRGIEDCRQAYLWMLNNGPDGESKAEKVFVAGDSAGGNLTLQLIAWLRDNDLPQVDAAVALSPTTDATYSFLSVVNNEDSDPMLGAIFNQLNKLPHSMVLWLSFLGQRINPSSPLVSPVFDDLSNLPPTLVHVSLSEVLFDDARRYVNKAIEAGSPVKLQSWNHMVHVWHMFYPKLDGAVEAWDEIEKFIRDIG